MDYIKIEITNVERLVAALDDFGRRQVPYAIALAANRVAKLVERALYAEMKQVFDRPVAWTLNSLYVKTATKRTMLALVKLKDEAYKGTPATKYLSPQIFGGSRDWKRHERALQMRGILPRGMYCVPGEAAKLDAYGNMSKGQIIQILSAMKAFGEQGYMANRTKNSAARNKSQPEYFSLQKAHGKLPPGIYQRFRFGHGTAIRPVLIFIKEPSYAKRFDFFGVAESVIAQHAEAEFVRALEYAKTAAFH